VRSLKWLGSGLYRCGRRGADLRSASAVILRSGGTRRTYRCRVGMHITSQHRRGGRVRHCDGVRAAGQARRRAAARP
jgi:hypothetical protein